MSDLEAQVVFTDSSPEPQECSVDEGEESEEGDQVDGDAGHEFDRLRRAVWCSLNDVSLRTEPDPNLRFILTTSFLLERQLDIFR